MRPKLSTYSQFSLSTSSSPQGVFDHNRRPANDLQATQNQPPLILWNQQRQSWFLTQNPFAWEGLRMEEQETGGRQGGFAISLNDEGIIW